METFPCLGLEILGQCQYNPRNPTVYFSIGQLLPLIAVFIAFYQILNPITKLRIESSNLFKYKPSIFGLRNWLLEYEFPSYFKLFGVICKNLISRVEFNVLKILAILSIFFIFISTIIPSILSEPHVIPLFGYPIFWELLAGFILLFISWYLIRVIMNPAQIRDENIDVWFGRTLDIIDRNEEKELIALAKEITPSLEKIIFLYESYEHFYQNVKFDFFSKYSKDNQNTNKKRINSMSIFKKIKKDKDFQKIVQLNPALDTCFKIIKFLSDKSFCKVVACKVPNFSEKFFSLFSKDTDIYPEGYTSQIFDNILQASFIYKESTLSRENQYDGLAGFKSLTSSIFKNHRLLQQRNPFGLLFPSQIEFKEDWQIKLYFSCLRAVIETSLNVSYKETTDGYKIIHPKDDKMLRNIYHACVGDSFINNGILENIPFNLSFDKKMNLFNTISFKIGQLLIFINEDEYNIKAFNIDRCNIIPDSLRIYMKEPHQISLYHILARMIFDFFIELSMIEVKNPDSSWRIRGAGIGCIKPSPIYKKMRNINDILITYIKMHIDEENFQRRHYPALTKYMLLLFGLYYPKKKENEWDEFKIYLLDKLKKEFHSLYTVEENFALDMLPLDLSYDPSTKVITQNSTSRWQKKITLQCE